MLADISLALSKLKMTYILRNKKISLTPDDLFSRFTEYLPLLSPNAMTWSFFLVILFFHAMSSELQEAVQLGGYIFPDISTLTTSLLQEQALQTLREIAVVSFKKLSDETRRIRRIMSQNVALNNSTQHHLVSNNDNTSSSPTLTKPNHQGPAAEQTITQHTNPETKQSDRPLTRRNNEKYYPTNPTNDHISNWEDGVQGCLGSGDSHHRFVTCTDKHKSLSRQIFWQEFWAHIPTTRTRKCDPIP